MEGSGLGRAGCVGHFDVHALRVNKFFFIFFIIFFL